jgi:hypothetical protein
MTDKLPTEISTNDEVGEHKCLIYPFISSWLVLTIRAKSFLTNNFIPVSDAEKSFALKGKEYYVWYYIK